VILFLDFDGVMHPLHGSEPVFCRVPMLAHWVQEWPGLEIVISSSWRQHATTEELALRLGAVIAPRVIGSTPLKPIRRHWGLESAPIEGRGVREPEIRATWAAFTQGERARVALDDQPALFSARWGDLIVCDPRTGLTATTLKALSARAAKAGLIRASSRVP
jgi:hypothetical protein